MKLIWKVIWIVFFLIVTFLIIMSLANNLYMKNHCRNSCKGLGTDFSEVYPSGRWNLNDLCVCYYPEDKFKSFLLE